MTGFFEGDRERYCWRLGTEIAGPECRARPWHDIGFVLWRCLSSVKTLPFAPA
jgi:hypothetical protein